MNEEFTYPRTLSRYSDMFIKAKRIAFDDAIFGDRAALLKKHFAEHPIYLDGSYYAKSDDFPMVKESDLESLARWRDCHYYSLMEYDGHRFFIMTGGRY